MKKSLFFQFYKVVTESQSNYTVYGRTWLQNQGGWLYIPGSNICGFSLPYINILHV